MKEKMKSLLKNCFGTTKRTVVTIVCIVAAVALLGSVTAYAAVRGTAIGAETAQNYAFADAGVDPAAAANIQTEFSYESGQFVYDIEFTADDTEYEYWIKASDGTVVKKSMEIVTLDGTTATVTAAITLEEAKTIAFADAGVNEDEVTIVKAELDYDDGLSVYDVEFYIYNVEYEYEVNANTGAIYSKSKETKVAAETNAETGNTTEAAVDEAATNAEATANTETATEETAANTDNANGMTDGTNSTTGDTSGTTDGSTNSGTTGGTTTTQITLAEAKEIALADAGVSASDVTYTKAKLDTDDGVAVYDIEFTTSTKEYDYEIKAADGTILDKDVETIKTSTGSGTTSGTTGSTSGTTNSGTTSGTTTTTQITLDEAKKVALKDAGVSSSNVTYTKAKLDTDDGVAVYDIEFYTSTKEYEYEIKASDGTILDKSVETIKTSSTGTTNSGTTSGTTNSGTTGSTSGTTTTQQITLDEAKKVALKDAGVSSSDVTYTKAKKDTDDGVTVYDIEFYTSTKEYEYEIKASDGTILDKSVETIKTSSTGTTNSGTTSGTTGSGTTGSTSGTTTTTTITLDEAKKVALKDAGVSSSDVTYTKAKKDTDDGVTVYDIEFYTSTKEYEYEIKASDGTILDKSVEAIKTNSTTNSGSTSGTTSTTDSSYISLDKAKTIALNKAGLSASEVTFEKAKLEKDDGIMVYELEFYKGNMEYECTVNATTGAIIDYEVDVDD